jgi:hypothetical protein
MKTLLGWLLAVGVTLVPASPSAADEGPPGNPRFFGAGHTKDGSYEVGAKKPRREVRSGFLRHVDRSDLIVRERYRQRCSSGIIYLGNIATCDFVRCEIRGRPGTINAVFRWTEHVVTAEPVGGVEQLKDKCIAEAPARQSLRQRVLQEVRALDLPAMTVRTDPAGETFVNDVTAFSVERPRRSWDLGQILGHRVTVEVTPIRYVWSFGDGASAVTKGREGARLARHTYAQTGQMLASVAVTYRGAYRVDGGSARAIPEAVTVRGPTTQVRVISAVTELVSGER